MPLVLEKPMQSLPLMRKSLISATALSLALLAGAVSFADQPQQKEQTDPALSSPFSSCR
jgi:hypothetical protein